MYERINDDKRMKIKGEKEGKKESEKKYEEGGDGVT